MPFKYILHVFTRYRQVSFQLCLIIIIWSIIMIMPVYPVSLWKKCHYASPVSPTQIAQHQWIKALFLETFFLEFC